jgi:hypothetical protein
MAPLTCPWKMTKAAYIEGHEEVRGRLDVGVAAVAGHR